MMGSPSRVQEIFRHRFMGYVLSVTGFTLQVWKESGPLLVDETYQLTREGVRSPDQVGKNRKHWQTLYMRLQVQLLQERLYEQQQKVVVRRK